MNQIKCEDWQYKTDARNCPFCGSASISVKHKEIRFLGINYLGCKKIKMKVYCICNKCKAAGTPVFYIGYTSGIYTKDHLPLYSCGEDAINSWNRRGADEEENV